MFSCYWMRLPRLRSRGSGRGTGGEKYLHELIPPLRKMETLHPCEEQEAEEEMQIFVFHLDKCFRKYSGKTYWMLSFQKSLFFLEAVLDRLCFWQRLTRPVCGILPSKNLESSSLDQYLEPGDHGVESLKLKTGNVLMWTCWYDYSSTVWRISPQNTYFLSIPPYCLF